MGQAQGTPPWGMSELMRGSKVIVLRLRGMFTNLDPGERHVPLR